MKFGISQKEHDGWDTRIVEWIFIIKCFRTIVFIFIVISSGVASSDSVSHNWVQVLIITVLLLACSQDWTCKLQMVVSLEA